MDGQTFSLKAALPMTSANGSPDNQCFIISGSFIEGGELFINLFEDETHAANTGDLGIVTSMGHHVTVGSLGSS